MTTTREPGGGAGRALQHRARTLCARPPLELRSAAKVGGRGPHRTVPPEATLAGVLPVLDTIGVTRLADITGLDRVGIPTYSAVVPDSAEILSIYNGKGVTRLDAKVGAVMEAVERHAAAAFDGVDVEACFAELADSGCALDPAACGAPLADAYSDDLELPWSVGWDLLAQRWVLIPFDLAGYGFRSAARRRCFQVRTTNGLASGNTLEEAICHALCELIERDAWSLAELLAEWVPTARRAGGDTAAPPGDDLERFPTVAGPTSGTAGRLLERYDDAGLSVRLRDITSDVGIATVFATTAEQLYPDLAMAHFGIGTHPDREVALVRSLTELAQSRAVDIQGAREDLSPPGAEHHPYGAHTKRVETYDPASWYHAASVRSRPMAELPTFPSADVRDDIELMLGRLRAAGVHSVVVVDLTDPRVGVPVVRLLAPELESWAVHHLAIGERAAAHWRAATALAVAPRSRS